MGRATRSGLARLSERPQPDKPDCPHAIGNLGAGLGGQRGRLASEAGNPGEGARIDPFGDLGQRDVPPTQALAQADDGLAPNRLA